MSIFQKTCPECTATNSKDAISCECGYAFDPEAVARADPTEYALQQDQLYRDYLAARIVQAEAELAVAREMAHTDPESTYKASTALLAEQALNSLRAEMKQLSLRISSSPPRRSANAGQRAPRPPSAPVPVQRPNPPAVVSKAVSSPVRKIAAAPHAAPVKAPIARVEPPIQRQPMPPAAGKPKAAPPPQKAVPAAHAAATRHASTAPQEPRRPIATAPAVRAQPTPPKAPPSPAGGAQRRKAESIASRPNEDFRRLQSQKAEAITRSKGAPRQTVPAAKPPRQAAPANIPPVVSSKKGSTQECPNCTAVLAANQVRCTCGYTLARPGEEVPALALDATALAILTDGISFNSNRRR